VHTISKLASLSEYRLLCLHPQEISVRRKRDSAIDRALGAALVAVIALDGARRVPVPERCAFKAEFSLRNGERLGA